MLSTAETIGILRGVTIFSGTSDDVLEQVSRILVEVVVPPGETVIVEGEPGTCMYIIVAGRVRVHVEGLTLNELAMGDVVGEMAALAPEPRTASVTAIEETRLFRLDQESFYGLVAKQPEVARRIVGLLTRYVRANVRSRTEDWQYIRQVGQITAAATAVEAGAFDPDALDEVGRRDDELGQLARVFRRMALEVAGRERLLKQEVQQLRIEIDQAKQARQVAEITETDYFRQLRERAGALRQGGARKP